VYHFARKGGIDLEILRERLRRMDDQALKRFGESAAFLSRPYPNEPERRPPEALVIQLREAREEWRRRHGDSTLDGARVES
jgi:hypothetical protein